MNKACWAMSERSIVILYVSLLMVCVALLVAANFMGPVNGSTVLTLASDGFKTLLGALVGVLSVTFGERKSK